MKLAHILHISAFGLALLGSPAWADRTDDIRGVAAQLKTALGDIAGLEIVTVGNVILLEGELQDASYMAKVGRISQNLAEVATASGPVLVRNTAIITDVAKAAHAQRIAAAIGNPNIRAQFVNDSLFLTGQVESDFEADRAVEITKAFLRDARSPAVAMQEEKRGLAKTPMKETSPVWGNVTIADLMRVRPRPAPAQKN